MHNSKPFSLQRNTQLCVAGLVIAAIIATAGNLSAQGGAAGGAGAGGRGAGGRGGDTTAAGGRQGGARGGRDATAAPAIPGGVLGGLPMTAADSMVKRIVERLDFNAYKETIRGLTRFGDREQGTQRNVDAMLWIESQLKSWGYTVERITYQYRGNIDSAASQRQEVYATKVGSTVPQEMYILGAHMDGRGGGEAANDDGSGTALVMEIARILASPDIQTTRSVRFALWNNEETGLQGAQAYVNQRRELQGIENPPGSGRYPEPKWLGMIQHDMMLWDHGNPVQYNQVLDADVDIEFQMNSTMAEQSSLLALKLLGANRMFATDYPAVVSG
jgi:hypothetical protein